MLMKMIRSLGAKNPASVLRVLMNIWRPFRGAGIRIREIAPDYRYVRVALVLRWFNRNYVGTQFGGSIYAMVDPFYMLMLMHNLGREYLVWDKGATIDFVAPGKMDLVAEFRIDEVLLSDVRGKTASGEKYVFDLPVEIRDADGALVATVSKKMYVRKKREFR
jgi:acyl-coenzyme A thioesterase PaaI-like protein